MSAGRQAGTSMVEGVSAVIGHELEHSQTPISPNADERFVWLEEGIAETLAWWPGTIHQIADSLGAPLDPNRMPSAYVGEDDVVNNIEYRRRQEAVTGLLSLAGVTPNYANAGGDHTANDAARALLQADNVERVPRALARAIAREKFVPSEDIEALSELIVEVDGKPDRVRELGELVSGPPAPDMRSRPDANVSPASELLNNKRTIQP
jgi:hypothetical protein